MTNQNDRSGASDASSNQPAEPEQKPKSGGHMGAGRSGSEDLGSEKPSVKDDYGSRKPRKDEN